MRHSSFVVNMFAAAALCFLALSAGAGIATAGCGTFCSGTCDTVLPPACATGICGGFFCSGACTCSPNMLNLGCLCK